MMPDMPNVGESTRKLGEWVKAHPIPSILMLIGAILIGVWASKNLKGGDKAVLASDELLEDAAGVGMGGAEEIKPTDFDTIVPSGLILPDYTYQQPSKQQTYVPPISVPTGPTMPVKDFTQQVSWFQTEHPAPIAGPSAAQTAAVLTSMGEHKVPAPVVPKVAPKVAPKVNIVPAATYQAVKASYGG